MKICPRCHLRYENQDNICPQDGVRLEALPEEKKQMYDALIGTVLESRYKIISKLGQGGMGAVYKAEQIRMNRICAIKVIPQDMAQNGDAIERFNREAQMSALINDPHAVTVYDFGETNSGMYFLAMEYVEGETLASLIKRERIIPLNRVFEIVRQAGQALACAHNQNIVHRDLKPDNIMLARKDGNDWVKVLDFGIAKRSVDDKSNDLTQTGMVIGTPLYMSPEQLAGDKLDPRSDIYSFSIIAYQLLTGKLPFSGENAQSIMVKRITENPIPPTVANPQVLIPPGVEAAIMNALVRNRNMRTPNIQKFVEQFEQGIRDFNNYKGKTSPNIALHTSPQPQNPFPIGPGNIPPTQNIPSSQHLSSNPQRAFTPPNSGTFPPNQPPPQFPPSGQVPFPSQPMSGMPTNPKPFSGNTSSPSSPTNPTPYPTPKAPMQPPISGQMPSYPTSIPPNPNTPPLFPPTQPMPGPKPSFPYQQPAPGQFQNPNNPFPQPSFPQTPPQPLVSPQVKKKSYKTFWFFAAIFTLIVLAGSCSVCVMVFSSKNGASNSTPIQEEPVNIASGSTRSSLDSNDTNRGWASETTTSNDAQAFYEKGVNYLEEEKYEAAIKEFKSALEIDPNFLVAQEDLSIALYNSKQYNEALEAFLQTSSLDSSNASTTAFIGFCYQLTNQRDLANETFDDFLENHPSEEFANLIKEIKNGNATPPENISYENRD